MQDKKPESIDALIESITPETYENLKTAVELGKWATGTPLTREQTAYCLQAIIAYEHRYLPADRRVGFIRRSKAEQSGLRSGSVPDRMGDTPQPPKTANTRPKMKIPIHDPAVLQSGNIKED